MRLIKEFYDRIGVYDKLRSLNFQLPGSAIGVAHYEIIESFMISVILGAGNCASASQISYDEILREIFQWEKGMPSQSTLSRFFPKYDHDQSDAIFSELFYWWFNQQGHSNLTLDIDSTVITRFGHQEGAEKGYNPKRPGRKSTIRSLPLLQKRKWWPMPGCAQATVPVRQSLPNFWTIPSR